MKKLLNQDAFNFTTDKAFAQVIGNCKTIRRKGRQAHGSHEVKKAYTVLHKLGFAHSAEVWKMANWLAVYME
jgi:leucyl/phenylalanyl-tRNA--protein transferase